MYWRSSHCVITAHKMGKPRGQKAKILEYTVHDTGNGIVWSLLIHPRKTFAVHMVFSRGKTRETRERRTIHMLVYASFGITGNRLEIPCKVLRRSFKIMRSFLKTKASFQIFILTLTASKALDAAYPKVSLTLTSCHRLSTTTKTVTSQPWMALKFCSALEVR